MGGKGEEVLAIGALLASKTRVAAWIGLQQRDTAKWGCSGETVS